MALHEDVLGLWGMNMAAQSCSVKTIRERLIVVRSFLRVMQVQDVAAVRKLDLLAYLARPELSTNSRATYRSTLSAFFRFLVDEGIIEHDPTARLPRVRVRQPEPDPVETDDMQRLLDSGIRRQTITKVLLYAYEGLRASEIAGIRGEDIDWDRGRIWVANAKGNRPVWRPLHSLVWTHVRLGEYPRTGYWFPSERSASGHVTGGSISDTISKAMQRAGIHHRPHDLRKWHGTTLIEIGADSFDVQHSLRHVDGQSMKAYIRPNEARIIAAKERLPRVRIPERERA